MNATRDGQAFRLAASLESLGMSPDDLLGLLEVAEVLGVSQSTAKNYARRADFPKPEQLSRGRVWRRAEVERWDRKVRSTIRGGRPPKKPS